MTSEEITQTLRDDLVQTIYTLQDKFLNFELGDEQVDVLVSIFAFLHKKGFDELVLSGPGGSGKSAITKLIVLYLEKQYIPYILATPTNKACGVLHNYTERDVVTLHKLLTLKPTIDIINLDFKDLQWNADSISSGIPLNGVLIIDECSMINSDLYEFIKERAKIKQCKVIYTGDDKQLYPVKEKELSKPFQCNHQYYLSKVYRQQENNPLLDILNTLRDHSIKQFYEIRSPEGNLVIFHHWRKFVSSASHLFKKSVDLGNPGIVKLLAYTNKRVEAFNHILRDSIFQNESEYNVGEILMGYDTCSYKDKRVFKSMEFEIINSAEYIVTNIVPGHCQLGYITYKGYYLTLRPINTEYSEDEIFIISRDTNEKDLTALAAYIELMRLDAIQARSKIAASKLWKEYFRVMESFTTPVDLVYGNRTVRKKTLDYGYCLSVHKSQGSNYDNILIDMGNLFTCKNKEELRQLQYVALSRTRNNISMLI
jgi:exodeoxyribonuclease-5